MKVDETSEVTSGGVAIPDSAKERPLSGTVVRVGDGKQNNDGTIQPCQVSGTNANARNVVMNILSIILKGGFSCCKRSYKLCSIACAVLCLSPY